MSEEPKNIWTKSFKGRTALVVWLAVAAFTIMLGSFIAASLNYDKPMSNWQSGAGILAGVCFAACLFLIYVVWPLSRWLFWRNCRRGIFLLACLVTLIALFYAEEDWRGWHAWNTFKHEWEAKGERFDRQSVIPPTVPDDQNFALTPLVATSYGQMLTRDGKEIPWKDRDKNFVNRMAMSPGDPADSGKWPKGGNWADGTVTDLKAWQAYYRGLAAKTNEFPVAREPQSPAQDVSLALSKYNSTIEELRQAAQLPYSRFPLEYDKENPWAILLPHLAVLKKCSQTLALRASAELQAGQGDQALADVKLSLRLADAIQTEPFLISPLVRMAMVQITLQPVYEGLADHRWSDAQLAALDAELAKLDFVADYHAAMRGEMILGQIGTMDYLRRRPEQIASLDGTGSGSPSLPTRILLDLIPRGWFYQNQLNCIRPMEELYLPVADTRQRTISPSKTKKADAAVKAQTRRPNAFNVIERMLLPSLGNASRRFAYGQAAVDLARTAIALERYRLAHGEYPGTLDPLTPLFGDKVPHDVINGQPLRYRLNAYGQFVLYSVGWNETDDGGVAVFTKGSTPTVDINRGDWVWKYPQK